MKKKMFLLISGAALLLLGACAKDTTRPYNTISTANTPTESQSADSGLVGYSNFESSLDDNPYAKNSISTEPKPLMSPSAKE